MNSKYQNGQEPARATGVEQDTRVFEPGYRPLFDTAQEGILILDVDTGRIRDANPFAVGLLGLFRSEMIGKTLGELGPFKDIGPVRNLPERLQADGSVHHERLRLETMGGHKITVDLSCNFWQVGDQKVIQCHLHNITEPNTAEAEILRLNAELEQNVREHTAQQKENIRKLEVLSRRLMEVQEIERRNIARELHDEIGQALTVLQLHLQAMLQSPGVENLKPRLNESLEVVEHLLEQVHDVAFDLRPSMLDDFGLEPALVWLTSRQAALAGLRGSVRAGALDHRLDPLLETACYRIAQEALTNVVRHARAHSVDVDLKVEGEQLHLRVRDDGVGFAVAVVREKSVRGARLGLVSMEERAALAGGGLEFTSNSGRGTEVHAWFPLK